MLAIIICSSFLTASALDDFKKARIDSLQNVVKNATYDTTRIYALVQLADEYHDSLSLAIDYIYQAMEIGKQLDDQKIIAKINYKSGNLYLYRDLRKKALEHFFKAYSYYQKAKDDKHSLMVIKSITDTYYMLNEDKLIDEYSTKGLKLATQLKDTTSIGNFLNMRGLMALRTKEYQQALKYFKDALKLDENKPDPEMQNILLNNIGMGYNFLEEYDQALKYLFRSVEKAEMGFDMFLKKAEKLKKNKEYIRKKVDFNIGNTYINIGTVYKNQKDYSKAIEYSEKGLKLISNNKRAFYQHRKVYNTLSQVYEAQNNAQKAFYYYKLFIASRDSMVAATNHRQLDKIQAEFVADTKEKEIANLKREAEITTQRNRVINTALGGGLFLMLTLAGLIYKRYDDKRKSHDVLSERNHEITAQNHEISAQRDQIADKNDKLVNAYQNITDSIEYAHRIQEALLPSLAMMHRTLPESMVMFKPRDVVSGDFYWFANVEDQANTNSSGQKTVLAAVDCTGHGVPGAFMSMAGDAYLNQIVKQQGVTQPDQVLTALHQNIRLSLKQETTGNRDGMDVSLVTINEQKQEVQFAGAKNPLIYIQDGELHLIKGDKYPIGGEQREGKRAFTTHTIQINPEKPTAFYLFSDGFQDQFGGEEGKKFMVSQFRDLLLSIHHLPMSLQKARLEQTFESWLETNQSGVKHEQVDDVLVMGFKV
ncbi:hypothetical protein BKI52_33835 [marine bacterium AO1-C]|nr:hypothetical protein BKI52_33835 [marine bacterium AO1-C]